MTHALQMRLSTVAIVVGFAVLIAILALALRNIRDMTAAIEWRQHTHEVIAEIRALLAHAVTPRRNMRGFVITGDERFLDPQTKAAGELPGSVAALRRLTSDNPSQRARLGRVEELVQQRLRSMAERIHQRREQGVSAAAAASLEGKHITDALRQALQEMEGAEQSLLAEREAAVRAEASRVDLTLLAGAVVSLVLLAGSFVGLHRRCGRGARRRRVSGADRRAPVRAGQHGGRRDRRGQRGPLSTLQPRRRAHPGCGGGRGRSGRMERALRRVPPGWHDAVVARRASARPSPPRPDRQRRGDTHPEPEAPVGRHHLGERGALAGCGGPARRGRRRLPGHHRAETLGAGVARRQRCGGGRRPGAGGVQLLGVPRPARAAAGHRRLQPGPARGLRGARWTTRARSTCGGSGPAPNAWASSSTTC